MKKILTILMILILSISGLAVSAFSQNHNTITDDTEFRIIIENGGSEVLVFVDDEETNSFLIDSNDENEIAEMIAERYNASLEEIRDRIQLQDNRLLNTTIMVTLMEESSEVIVEVDGVQTQNFSLNMTDTDAIIEEVAQILNVSVQGVSNIIEFEELNNLENVTIMVTLMDDSSDIEIERDSELIDSYTLNLTERDEIIVELAKRLNVSVEAINDVIEFEEETLIIIEEIMVTIKDADSLVVVEFEEEDEQEFTLNTTDREEIVTILALRYNVTEETIENVIEFEDENSKEPASDMIEVTLSLDEFMLYRVFINFMNVFEEINDNVENNNFAERDNIMSQDMSPRTITVTEIDLENNEVTIEVDRGDWFMFKFLRSYVDIKKTDLSPMQIN